MRKQKQIFGADSRLFVLNPVNPASRSIFVA
jgi:hypothetical protein